VLSLIRTGLTSAQTKICKEISRAVKIKQVKTSKDWSKDLRTPEPKASEQEKTKMAKRLHSIRSVVAGREEKMGQDHPRFLGRDSKLDTREVNTKWT